MSRYDSSLVASLQASSMYPLQLKTVLPYVRAGSPNQIVLGIQKKGVNMNRGLRATSTHLRIKKFRIM